MNLMDKFQHQKYIYYNKMLLGFYLKKKSKEKIIDKTNNIKNVRIDIIIDANEVCEVLPL